MKNHAIIFVLFIHIFSSLEALNRDYLTYVYDENGCPYYLDYNNNCYYQSDFYCLYHIPFDVPKEIDPFLLKLVPETEFMCESDCFNSPLYLGYIDPNHNKYLSHFRQHLEYTIQHPNCLCLWPECSQESAQISDTAYLLFRDLILTTALSNLIENKILQSEFLEIVDFPFTQHGLAVSLIAQQFRFSDYYQVCKDIENYALSKYDEWEAAKIKDKLEDILEVLYPKFFTLYISCHQCHPNSDIDLEIRFMKMLVNDISGLQQTEISSTHNTHFSLPHSHYDRGKLTFANLKTLDIPVAFDRFASDKTNKFRNKKRSIAPFNASFNALFNKNIASKAPLGDFQVLTEQGSFFNSLLLYKEAIEILTLAIQLNPANRDAYIERAMAYFETNQLSLALKDYETARTLTLSPIPFQMDNQKSLIPMYIPENKIQFSTGLISGTLEGAQVSAKEFVPSIFSCCRGILNGLWAFTSSPAEVSKEMVNAAYAIGEFIQDHTTKECLIHIVSELKDLSISWNKLNDQEKGHKIGFIIGKYGIDIFAPIGALKGLQKLKALKRANTMCTLENCAASQAKQAKILEESVKRASIREKIISDSIKNSKILVRNSNTQAHIVQPRHTWDKLIKMSGNVEEDCKKVITLLEDNQIFLEKYRVDVKTFEKAVRYEHEMKINGHGVKAIFNKNLETGDLFLNDAWVITK